MPYKHTISSTGFSNLFGYGIPDLIKALELGVDPLEIDKLRTSEFNNNVALNALNALEAWQAGYTGKGVKVGVFDAGVGINTPEALLELPNAVLYRDAVDIVSSHGFRVSQYILAKNQMPSSVGGTDQKSEVGSADERDVTGVAFDADFYFASADLHSIGINIGNNEEAAFQWFVEQNVDVINWSGSLRYDFGSQFYRAIELAHEKGIIIVVSAGNDAMGMDEGRIFSILRYANEFDNIVVASSTMPDTLELYSYSNHAGDIVHNNFTVVEDYSYAFYPSGEYESNINGTSFAAPYLTGAVALIIQKLRNEGKYDIEGDYREVIRLLKNSASIPSQSDAVLTSYNLSAVYDSRDEGSTAFFSLVTTNLDVGTSVAYTLSGVSASDLESGSLTGTATVSSSGTTLIDIPLALDKLTEGAETLTITLDDSSDTTASLVVNDTSKGATYSVTASSTSYDEGQIAQFSLITTGVDAGAVVAYTISGVSASDLVSGSLTGTATVSSSGTTLIDIPLALDKLTEGAETLTFTLDDFQDKTASITVNDTSIATVTETNEYQTTILADENVLGPNPVLIKGLNENITTTDGIITDHFFLYAGIRYEYSSIDSLLTVITRDDEFTSEFSQEISDYSATLADMTYSDAIKILGVSGIDGWLITVAGDDGNYVG